MQWIDDLLGGNDRALLPRGDKLRASSAEHLVGLVARLLRRALQLLLVLWLWSVARSERAAELLTAQIFVDLNLAEAGHTALEWLARICFWLLLLLLAGCVHAALEWRSVRFLLSDRRVLQAYGVLRRVVIDTPLDRVDTVALSQSPLGRHLDYGDVYLRTGADGAGVPMRRMIQPQAFHEALERQRSELLGLTAAEPRERGRGRAIGRALGELKQLRDSQVIGPEDYAAKKTELLKRL